jgi:hypothetical protein
LGELTEKAAAQTVRTVALIGGAEALGLLVRYAQDTREEVIQALIEAWGYFDADAYADRVLAGVALKGRRVEVTHSGQWRAVKHLPAVDNLWVSYPVTDLSLLSELHPLTKLTFADLGGEVDLSALELHALPALETLYFSCHSLTDLHALSLPTALRYLGLLSIDPSLDLACLSHNQITWLGLIMSDVCLPRGAAELLTNLPRLKYLYLRRVDLAAWLETEIFPPPTVRNLHLVDCVLPRDPAALDFPGVDVTIL